MPRRPRIEFEGATYHVMARGNRGDDIFVDRQESTKFLDLFDTIASDQGWEVFAYCLMPNHYHLLIRTPEPSLSKGMQRLNSQYAQWINWKREIDGHLLQGRYKAILVDADAYLTELVRYIGLNPVRAGLADRPEQWIWSSYRLLHEEAAKGTAKAPSWLKNKEILDLLAGPEGDRLGRLERFIAIGLERDQRDVASFEAQLESRPVLGSKDFIARLSESLGLANNLANNLTPASPQPLSDFAAQFEVRDEAMAAAFWLGGYRPKEIAAGFGVHPSAVTRAKTRYEAEFTAKEP